MVPLPDLRFDQKPSAGGGFRPQAQTQTQKPQEQRTAPTPLVPEHIWGGSSARSYLLISGEIS